MDLPGKTKYSLIGFLLFITLLFKYPTDPHEYGLDSFQVHGMAGSLQELNYYPGLIHPASAYALYPFSYAPGMAFVLSSLADITGLSIEFVILFLTIILSIFGGLGIFMFTAEIRNKFEIKYLSAYLFIFTPIITTFMLWTISARGPFVCMLTVLLWLLAKMMSSRHKTKFAILSLIYGGILPTIHHLSLLIPILLIAVLTSFLVVKGLSYTKKCGIYYEENVKFASVMVLMILIILFYLQATSVDLYAPSMGYFKVWYLYDESGGPFPLFVNMVVYYGISMGVLMLYAGLGFANILEKVEKTPSEWTLLFFILFFALFLVDDVYLKMFVVPLFLPLAAIGIYSMLNRIEHRKLLYFGIFGTILMIAPYYANFANEKWSEVRTKEETNYHFYMDEEPYNTAIYMRYNHRDNENFIHNDKIHKRRFYAISGAYILPLDGLDVMAAYPEIQDKVIVKKHSITEMYYEHYDSIYYADWRNSTAKGEDNYTFIVRNSWDNKFVMENLSEYRVSYAVVYNYFPDEYGASSRPYVNEQSRFFSSLREDRYCLYGNDSDRIYFLLP